MTQCIPIDLSLFKEAIQHTATFRAIQNTAIKKLYSNARNVERIYENSRQGIRYDLEYLRQKPSLNSRDYKIIHEILNK